MRMYNQGIHNQLKKMAEEETPPVADALAWLAYREGKPDRGLEQLQLAENFVAALEKKDARIDLQPFPEMEEHFRDGVKTFVSRKLLDLIETGVRNNGLASRDGYEKRGLAEAKPAK